MRGIDAAVVGMKESLEVEGEEREDEDEMATRSMMG